MDGQGTASDEAMGNVYAILVLIRELAALPKETEWVEFKRNKAIPDEIGEYLSALANSATLHDQAKGYLVWGIDNVTKNLVGTTFRPRTIKRGNEALENWLSSQLHPPIRFLIREADHDGNHFVVIEVPAASHTPVRFKDFAYIRVGSVTKKLRDHPEKERAIWAKLAQTCFEEGVALDNASADDVLRLIEGAYESDG